MNKHEEAVAWLKLLIVWLGTAMSNISNWVLFFTLVYTILQIYILVRDKILQRKE